MAAIANELADDAMQHAFSDGLIEKVIRPLIAEEEFFAGFPLRTAKCLGRPPGDARQRSRSARTEVTLELDIEG